MKYAFVARPNIAWCGHAPITEYVVAYEFESDAIHRASEDLRALTSWDEIPWGGTDFWRNWRPFGVA